MSVIQALSYPVSAVAQSQTASPREGTANQMAFRPAAVPAIVSAQTPGVSNRVNAYLSIDRTDRTRRQRPEDDASGSDDSQSPVQDETENDPDDGREYRPASMY